VSTASLKASIIIGCTLRPVWCEYLM